MTMMNHSFSSNPNVAIAALDLGMGDKIITFQGLMDLWVAAKLRGRNISWPMVRLAAHHASRI
jgi:hypothetical protein